MIESPLISNPGTGEPERPFTRAVPGAARRALPALHKHGATWQHPSLSAGHAPWSEAPLFKSFRCVSFPVCASLSVASLVWCGLSALGSDSQTHSHSALPLGAVWDQRVHGNQQQVLHFYRRCHACGFSQSERPQRAPGVGQTLLRWSEESMRLRGIICNSQPRNGFHLNCNAFLFIYLLTYLFIFFTKSHSAVFSH